MDNSTRTSRLVKMLHQIAPESRLERLSESLEAGHDAEVGEQLDVGRRSDDEESAAMEALDVLVRGGPLDGEQHEALEAIIHKRYRPAVDIVNDTFALPPPPWEHLGSGGPKQMIDAVIQSIGRIEIPNDPMGRPYAGTGFVVGRNLLMTNRHVAELFATGLGQRNLFFRPGQAADVDFKREI